MKSKIFCIFLCFIFVVPILCLAAGSPETDGELVRICSGTTVYNDAELTKAVGILPSDAVVYTGEARTSSAGAVIEIIYCRDFIVRHAFIPLLSAVPLTPPEKAAYAADSTDGILIRPGISLLNIELSPVSSVAGPSEKQDPTPEPEYSSETILPSVTSLSTPGPTPSADPSEEAGTGASSLMEGSMESMADAPDPDSGITELHTEETPSVSQYAESRLKAVPTGRHYILNASAPIHAGSVIRSVTLYPMNTGLAEGTISVLYVSDGKYQIAYSKDFSLTVPYGSPWETVIPLEAVCEGDAFVTVCFGNTCTARYGMAASETGSLYYFSGSGDDPVILSLDGYAVNYTISFK